MREERRFVNAGFLTANPSYPKKLGDIVTVLMANENYVPDRIEIGGLRKETVVHFEPRLVEEYSNRWSDAISPIVWHLEKTHPRLTVVLVKTNLPFAPLNVHLERDFLTAPYKIEEFRQILTRLYEVSHPAYGNAHIRETLDHYDDPLLGRTSPGTNLERGIPGIYWLNFFGPEYVEMFGPKIWSAPCYKIERLADGGALLILSPSPLDHADKGKLEDARQRVKGHLGTEAFDTGDSFYRGKIPKFRYVRQLRP